MMVGHSTWKRKDGWVWRRMKSAVLERGEGEYCFWTFSKKKIMGRIFFKIFGVGL